MGNVPPRIGVTDPRDHGPGVSLIGGGPADKPGAPPSMPMPVSFIGGGPGDKPGGPPIMPVSFISTD